MIKIRERTQSDAQRLNEIWQKAVEATHDFLTEADICFYREQVRDIYLPQLEVWVAETVSGKVAGFVGLSGSQVEMLFVDPDCHGQGIGKALLAQARGLKGRLTVDVNEQNPGGHAFYRRCGFRDVGRSALDGSGRPFPLIHMAQTD